MQSIFSWEDCVKASWCLGFCFSFPVSTMLNTNSSVVKCTTLWKLQMFWLSFILLRDVPSKHSNIVSAGGSVNLEMSLNSMPWKHLFQCLLCDQTMSHNLLAFIINICKIKFAILRLSSFCTWKLRHQRCCLYYSIQIHSFVLKACDIFVNCLLGIFKTVFCFWSLCRFSSFEENNYVISTWTNLFWELFVRRGRIFFFSLLCLVMCTLT